MKILHLTLTILLAGAVTGKAQVSTLAKPVQIHTSIMPIHKGDKARPAKKINPLYARNIEHRQVPVLDTDKNEARLASSESTAAVAEIKAFPNPFTSQIDIIITDGAMSKSLYKADMYDLTGKLVYSETLLQNQSSLKLSQLSTGVYFLHIEKNGVPVKYEKFVKE